MIRKIKITTKMTVFLIASFLTLLSLLTVTYAWLSKSHRIVGRITIGGMEHNISVEFSGVSSKEISDCYDENLGLLMTDATKDNNSPNNIENMSVDLNIYSEIPLYCRVKIMSEWYLQRTYKNVDKVTNEVASQTGISGKMNYEIINLDNDWIYDPLSGYLYYKYVIPKDVNYTIPFINRGTQFNTINNRVYEEICTCYIEFSMETVQINRYKEVWGTEIVLNENVK